MAKTLVRDIRSVTVGTGSTLLLPERTGRLLTVIGAPPPPAAPVAAAPATLKNAAVTAVGVLLAYSIPANTTVRITGWSWNSASVTAVLGLRLLRSGLAYIIDQGAANVFHNLNLSTTAPDTVSIYCVTAGGAGETADLVIAADSYPATPRISLGMGSAAVLDQGITIYAGQLPLILPGPALDSEIYGAADAAGRLVNVIDLFYP